MSPVARGGESLTIRERMIVAPSAGIFRLTALAYCGAFIAEGDEIGVVVGPGSSQSVLSPFEGTLMGVLAVAGQRLRAGDPIAWLRLA